MIKKTSKITMITALVLAGVVNAQEFYTCVPKKSWWKDTIKESIPSQEILKEIKESLSNNFQNADKLAEIIAKGIRNSKKTIWKKIVYLKITSPISDFKQVLQPGYYRVTAAAAGSQEVIKEFSVTREQEFLACVGAAGGNGGKSRGVGYYSGGGGGGGGRGYMGCYNGESGAGVFHSNEWWSTTGGTGGCGGSGAAPGDNSKNKSSEVDDCNIECKDLSRSHLNGGLGGRGGYGCKGGKGGALNDSIGGGGGGGGGSYFKVADVELILKGGDGKPADGYNGGAGAGPDGYVIVEKME